MRHVLSTAALMLAVAACGSDDTTTSQPAETVTVTQTPDATPTSPSPAPTTTTTEAVITLPQACRAIAKAAYSTFDVPSVSQAQALVDEINRLLEKGDAETVAAIQPLQDSANLALESAKNESDYGAIFEATADLFDRFTVLNESCGGALDFTVE